MQLAYSADVIRSNTAEIAEVLTDTVLNPKFNPWEVAEQIFRLKEDLKKYQSNHMGTMQEVIHPSHMRERDSDRLPSNCITSLEMCMFRSFIRALQATLETLSWVSHRSVREKTSMRCQRQMML